MVDNFISSKEKSDIIFKEVFELPTKYTSEIILKNVSKPEEISSELLAQCLVDYIMLNNLFKEDFEKDIVKKSVIEYIKNKNSNNISIEDIEIKISYY